MGDTQAMLCASAAASAALAALAAWREHRRVRRADLDRVGVIAWRTVQLAGIAATILFAALALHA